MKTKTSTSADLVCGWPSKCYPGYPSVCPCGFIFPEKINVLEPDWHKPEKHRHAPGPAIDWDDPPEDDMDFG